MRRIRFIFFLQFISLLTFSQQLYVENYTPANGLLDTRVNKIFQDNRGLLYFLTWEGLSVYDGQRFKNITEYNGEALGLVNDMIQWEKDTCYVFTFQKGIFKLVNGRLIKDTTLNHIVETNRVLPLSGKDRLIISNSGLFTWNGISCHPFIPKRKNRMQDFDNAVIKNKSLIFSSFKEAMLTAVNLITGDITDSLPHHAVSTVISDGQSNIFIYADGNWQQLNNDSLQKGRLKLQPLYFKSMLPAEWRVQQMYFTGQKVWIKDFEKGYLVLDSKTGIKEFYTPAAGIAMDANTLFADNENNYWFSTFNKQVQRCFYTRLKQVAPGLSPGIVNLFTDESGTTVAGNGERVYVIEPGGMQERKTPGQKSVTAFYWLNRSWAFVSNSLIKSERGDIIDLRKTDNTDTSFYYSGRFLTDREGRLVISGNSLYVVEKDFTVHGTALKYFTDYIAVDGLNNYWAFSRNGDIDEYTFTGKGISHLFNYKPAPVGPRFAIHLNADTFCIGTRNKGVVWLKVTKDQTTIAGNLHSGNGLSNNFVVWLIKKNKNQLLAATGFGVDEITMQNGDTTVENMAASSNLFMPFSFLSKNNNGDVFARSDDGRLWQVNDLPAAASAFIPGAWLEEITVNGKPVNDSIHHFSYNQNNMRFIVAAPCLVSSRNLRFTFVLKSENSNWQQQSPDNFYSINNLAPGSYTLTVTVSYPGKMYPGKKITYNFSIHPPLWKRWWFRLSVSLLLAAFLWALARNYYRRKLAAQKAEAEKKQAIEKERNRISRDMHDDLGSGLTKIAILSEVAKKQLPEPDKAKEQLEKISLSSRELVDNLQDIIWVLNPANDTLESLAAYIREYTLKYFEPFEIKTTFIYPEQFSIRDLSEEKRRNTFLTVKETLHNTAKHAWCNEVTISINEGDHFFTISIKDDGKGFEQEKIRMFANGLKNMQNRVEQAGGEYEIISEPGKGTKTIIRMPV